MNVGSLIRLDSKTRNGNNKIQQWGSLWVISTAENIGVSCLKWQPGLLIMPVQMTGIRGEGMRWILQNDDPDFYVTELAVQGEWEEIPFTELDRISMPQPPHICILCQQNFVHTKCTNS